MLGVALLLLGAVAAFGPSWIKRPAGLRLEVDRTPPIAQFDETTAFPVRALHRYRLMRGNGATLRFTVAAYHDASGQESRALVYLPAPDAPPDATEARHAAAWRQAADAIRRHTPEEALVLAWWDNVQRLRLFTGRGGVAALPDPAAFATAAEGAVWRELAGGASQNGALKALADWYTQPADAAVRAIAARFGRGAPVLLVATTDDLARAMEIGRLGGRTVPVEAVEMSFSGDVHGGVARIRQWATEPPGTGSYLVQPLGGGRLRAWRITAKAAEEWLLIRLLPFTTSLSRPVDALPLVYQSGSGAYLSVYQLQP